MGGHEWFVELDFDTQTATVIEPWSDVPDDFASEQVTFEELFTRGRGDAQTRQGTLAKQTNAVERLRRMFGGAP